MIYDFDGTLFHSPNKELGEQLYEKSTGKKWPFKGWWGRKDYSSAFKQANAAIRQG